MWRDHVTSRDHHWPRFGALVYPLTELSWLQFVLFLVDFETDWNSYRASWVHRTKTKTIGRCPGINYWSNTYRILHIETISRKLSSRQGQGQIRHSKRFSQNAKMTKISKICEFRKTRYKNWGQVNCMYPAICRNDS